MPSKEINQLIRQLKRVPGVTIAFSGGKHLQVRRNGVLITTLPSTPNGGCRSLDNCIAGLRRAGIDLRPRPRKKAS